VLPLAVDIDWAALIKVVYYSLASSVGVTVVFSLAIVALTRSGDRRRADHSAAAAAYGVLGASAMAVCAAVIVFGIIVMTTK
jgi:hypothetical protein